MDQTDILNPSKSIYEILAEKRAMLEQQRPDVAAMLPVLGAATPGQRMQETAQNQPAQDLASTIQGTLGMATQAITGPGAKPKDQQAVNGDLNAVLDSLNPLKPQQTYGPNVGKALGMGDNAGGILGLGIQPIDLLAFTIGAALTSRMPQDKALSTTMAIAGLPKQFRDSQEASARAFIDDKLKQINSGIAGENLAQRQIENAQKNALVERKDAITGMVAKRLATGQPLTEPEQKVIAVLGHGVFDPAVIKELMTPDIGRQMDALKAIQGYAQANNMGSVSSVIDAPGGQKITIGSGNSSGRPVTAGELSDALATGRNTDRLLASGYDVTTPQGRAIVQQGLNERRAMEQQRIVISQQNSARADKALEVLRPDERKELTGLKEIYRGGTDLLAKYEAALKSHKGQFGPDVQIALAGATRSPDSFLGGTIQSLSQRYPKLSKEDLEFVSRYASMAKFARASLNDVGNLSNFERGIFQTMLGTPLDKPELFRARISTMLSDAQQNYQMLHGTLEGTRNLKEFGPLGGPSAPQAAPAEQPTHIFNLKTGKVEVVRPTK